MDLLAELEKKIKEKTPKLYARFDELGCIPACFS